VVFGVAILGSLVNARLKADLVRELQNLHVPSIFHDPIIHAYENGQLQSSGGSGGGGLLNWFVDQIRASAFVAFHDGLTTALTISAILIAAAALYAGYAAARNDGR
jgi:hypothetical protein